MIFDRLIQWMNKRRIKTSKNGDFYRCVYTATIPSKPNAVVKICDWNPKQVLLNIRSYISSITVQEDNHKVLCHCDKSSGCVTWLDNKDQAIFFKANERYCGDEVTVIVDYNKQ